MQTVTKADLARRVSGKTGVPKGQVRDVIQCFLDEITGDLDEGNRVEFRDVGVFEPRILASRLLYNPQTGKKQFIPERMSVRFKVGSCLKKLLQGTEGS